MRMPRRRLLELGSRFTRGVKKAPPGNFQMGLST
jgi:hypothetical protein